MVDVATKHAAESLSTSRESADVPTVRTGLRRVRGRHLDESSSIPGKLVSQHVCKPRPSSPGNATSETVVLEHAPDVELFDDNRAVALGVGSRQLVQDVVALSLDLAMDATHTIQGFCPVLGSFLSSISDVLGATKSLQGFFKVRGIASLSPLGISKQIGDASIDGHHRNSPRAWIGNFVLAQDAGKPLISVPPDRTCFRLPFERPVNHDLQGSNLGEVQLVAGESPDLGMWFAKPKRVPSFLLPSRLIGQLLETSLPCFVQFHEQLGAHVARNFRKPGQLGPQSCQLVDLIERGNVLPLVARPGKTDQPLLIGEVPQETQGALPTVQIGSLPLGWIEPEAKSLANEHEPILFLAYAAVKRLSDWTPCGFLSHRAFGLCAKIQEARHLAASLRDTSRCVENGLCRLRVRTQGGRIRERPCTPAHRLPSQGGTLHLGQLPEGSLSQDASIGSTARSVREALGRTFLVSFVLCRFVRRSPTRSCQTVRRKPTRRPRFPLSLKGEVSARETR